VWLAIVMSHVVLEQIEGFPGRYQTRLFHPSKAKDTHRTVFACESMFEPRLT
jgi:hypothetical protein